MLNFRTFFTVLLLLGGSFSIFAQTKDWKATRCSGVDRSRAINNITLGSGSTKLVANTSSVFEVQSCDLATPQPLSPGEQSVLAFRGGNTDLRWTLDALRAVIPNPVEIKTAWYNAATDRLWLGTKSDGVFVLKAKPQLQLIDQITSTNSKLKSNQINIIFQDPAGIYWIGTEEGLLTGTPGKWKYELSGYGIQRVRAAGSDIFVLGDGEFWKVENGDKWRAITIDESALEGEPRDFDLAPDGTLWILSAMASAYNLETDEFSFFSGIQDYTSEYGTCIAADPDGEVWIGTSDKGLYHIGIPTGIAVACMVDQPLSCQGNGRDGAVRVKTSGGTAPLTYKWSAPGLEGENPQQLAAGKYTVTVTDSKGLSKTGEVMLEDPRMTLDVKILKPETGPDAADGNAEVVVTGGNPRYQYRWDNGETANVARKLGEGQHSVTVTDAKGCSATGTVKMTQSVAELSVTIEEATPVKCTGGKTAVLHAAVQGGRKPYKIVWSMPGVQEETISGLGAGVYKVTVTDALGATAGASFTVEPPAPYSAVALGRAAATANQANGQAAAQVQGGTGPYNYLWDNGEKKETALALPAGRHAVTITDANGCVVTASVDITENILPLAVQLTERTGINCNGAKEANLTASISGGKGPFKLAWNNPALSGESLSGLAAGVYALTVSDAAGATTSTTYTIKQPDVLSVSIAVKAMAAVNLANGQAEAAVKGGTEPYNYQWDNGETDALAIQLAPGNRSITVTDAKGCTATAAVAVTENIFPLAVKLETKSAIKCQGQKTAALDAIISGGKGPYSLTWSDPALSGEKLNGLGAGVYSLSVTDMSGKQFSATATITEPEALSLSAQVKSQASVNQSDGAATVKPSGGKTPYAFKWDNGETVANAVKLPPGQRTLTITDANGCTATAALEITENIMPLEVSLQQKAGIRCAESREGAITANIKGGKPPYILLWNSPNLKGEELKGLSGGIYAVTVSDAKGNTQAASLTIAAPDSLVVNISRVVGATTDRTRDGKAVLDIKGGKSPYVIAWDNGESSFSAKQLTQGVHSVNIADANGCSTKLTVEVGQRILPALTPGMLSNGQTIRMERLQFEADSSRITPSCLPVLDEVYDFLTENGNIVIEIGGHTNSTPPDEFCDRLSTARSKSVADYLISKGINPKRVVFKGYGKRKPVASNATPEGRKQNQRVEIKILEIN